MKHARINIHCNATKAPVKETLNGREVYRVASATLPDNVVMNGIMYPAEEIEASYSQLEGKPAPLGHPSVGGMYVSALHPQGINGYWVGAWNTNVTRKDGRVFLDKIIDVEVANQTEKGKKLLAAINAGSPIHTSTGVLLDLEKAPQGTNEYEFIARNMDFDHDAILMDEPGAATPEQGVGMMVNSKGEEIEVVNSYLESEADFDFERAAEIAVRAGDRMAKAGMVQRMKAAIMEAMLGSNGGSNTNSDGEDEMADNEQLQALSTKVNALEESMKTLPQTVVDAVNEAVKPLSAHVEQIQANQKATEQAELDGLVSKIVKANILDEDSAKELTLNAARKLAERATPGAAAPINGAFAPNTEVDSFGYDINATMGLNGSDKGGAQ